VRERRTAQTWSLSIICCMALLSVTADVQAAEDQPLRVLFVGNSFTYFNNLPEMFGGIARARGEQEIEVSMAASPGWTLYDHWNEGQARNRLMAQAWDVVVLQEQSTLGWTHIVNGRETIGDPTRFHEATRLWHGLIEKKGARTVLLLTWARADSPTNQTALNKAYFGIAQELGVEVTPAGIAWRHALAEQPELDLHQEDGLHPSQLGSYLTVCTLFSTLFAESPEGLPHRFDVHAVSDSGIATDQIVSIDIPVDTARVLQTSAWQTAGPFAPASDWNNERQGVRDPVLVQGEPLEIRSLDGEWHGSMFLLPDPRASRVHLAVEPTTTPGHVDIRVEIDHADNSFFADQEATIHDVPIGTTKLEFSHAPKGFGSVMRYEFVFASSRLKGIVSLLGSETVSFIAEVELERNHNDP
jgi:hypothetical protein